LKNIDRWLWESFSDELSRPEEEGSKEKTVEIKAVQKSIAFSSSAPTKK